MDRTNIKPSLLKCAMVFTIASAAIAASGHAQNFNDASGDLFLCFQDFGSTDPGYSENLIVDIGSFANYIPGGSETGGTQSISQLMVSDLSNIYGSNWYSLPNLKWGVVGGLDVGEGSDGVPDYTLFGTDTGTAYTSQTNSAQGNSTGQIDTWVGEINGLPTTSGTASIELSTSNPYSFSQAGHAGNNATGIFGFNEWTNSAVLKPVSPAPSTSALYEIKPGTGSIPATDLGNFTLSTSGLTFTAVPEPSTWATICLGAVSLVVFRRRRSVRG